MYDPKTDYLIANAALAAGWVLLVLVVLRIFWGAL